MFRFKDYFKNRNTLIIAEFANAFEGKKDIAFKMVDQAVKADVDALKFQIFFAEELLIPEHPKYELFRKLETNRDHWNDILYHAFKSDKLIFIDVFGEQSLLFCNGYNIDGYKIPSSEMNHYALINEVSLTGRSMILSAGGATIQDIEKAVSICERNDLSDFVIMHGFQAYPTRLKDTHLNFIKTLEKTFNCIVGYADHVDGGSELALVMPLLAVCSGARIIEKHFTLDRQEKGIDYQSSVNPENLKKVVEQIRNIDIILGSNHKNLSQDEHEYKQDVRKRIIAKRDLVAGETISDQDVILKRAPRGYFGEELERIIGQVVRKDIAANDVIELE